MFGLFKKKGPKKPDDPKAGGGDEPPSDDAQFYQAVVNKFVTMIDDYAESNPELPEFRQRWAFHLEDINAWMPEENSGRMSCKIIAKDMGEEYPDFGEWAHGFGDSIDSAFNTGFNNWITTDLPVLIDLLSDEPTLCNQLEYENPDAKTKVRGLLGPMQFWSFGENGPQPCCNTCIFTQALQADETIMSRQTPMLIKAVVARNPDNTTTSDFRINDVQDDKIAASLSEWAKSWEGQGFAMRKQSLLFVSS